MAPSNRVFTRPLLSRTLISSAALGLSLACGPKLDVFSTSTGGAGNALSVGGSPASPTGGAGNVQGSGGALGQYTGGAGNVQGSGGALGQYTGGAGNVQGSGGALGQFTGGAGNVQGSGGAGCTGNLEEIQSKSGLCVAKMATITGPASNSDAGTSDTGETDYSIDVTEVTKGQYDAWLATSPALPASDDANCGYVMSYADQQGAYTGTDADHHPVVYVDWCDAYAYCKGVGKRLCGAIGGGTNPQGSEVGAGSADGTSQWYQACSSGGTYTYPYGNTYNAGFCDGVDYWSNYSAAQTVAVGSLANCVTSTTGYAGVYDLSGNVYEWEDSCDGIGEMAFCPQRGGVYIMGGSQLACDFDGTFAQRGWATQYLGFRCCSQ